MTKSASVRDLIVIYLTDAMFDKQVKNALREFGIPEDVIQQQNFKYG